MIVSKPRARLYLLTPFRAAANRRPCSVCTDRVQALLTQQYRHQSWLQEAGKSGLVWAGGVLRAACGLRCAQRTPMRLLALAASAQAVGVPSRGERANGRRLCARAAHNPTPYPCCPGGRGLRAARRRGRARGAVRGRRGNGGGGPAAPRAHRAQPHLHARAELCAAGGAPLAIAAGRFQACRPKMQRQRLPCGVSMRFIS